jgi:hypothetical protein
VHFFLFFFLHLVAPSSDLHVSKSVKQSAWQSAKTTHGGSEGTGGEGDGGGGLAAAAAHIVAPRASRDHQGLDKQLPARSEAGHK